MCVYDSTSLQQAVGVTVLQQIAIDGDVVQRLQRRTLLHVLVRHRETRLGAVPHQTTTTNHTAAADRVATPVLLLLL